MSNKQWQLVSRPTGEPSASNFKRVEAPVSELQDGQVLVRANAFSRIAMCGMIAGHNGESIPLQALQLILINRMKVQGFIGSEQMEHWPRALQALGAAVAGGKLKDRKSVAEGNEAAPEAFFGLLKGKNFGKQLVKVI